jgi:hypothetical protein
MGMQPCTHGSMNEAGTAAVQHELQLGRLKH